MSNLAYRVVGVSHHTTEALHLWEKIPQDKLVTVTNGIEGARFTPRPGVREAKREALGLASDEVGCAERARGGRGRVFRDGGRAVAEWRAERALTLSRATPSFEERRNRAFLLLFFCERRTRGVSSLEM